MDEYLSFPLQKMAGPTLIDGYMKGRSQLMTKNVSRSRTTRGVQKRKVGGGISGTWTVDKKYSFDRTAEEDSRSAILPSCVEMTVEGAFTHVNYLIVDWSIPLTPFGIRLRWKSHPVAQFSQFASVVRGSFRRKP